MNYGGVAGGRDNSMILYRYDDRSSKNSPLVAPLVGGLSKREIVKMKNFEVSDNDLSPI